MRCAGIWPRSRRPTRLASLLPMRPASLSNASPPTRKSVLAELAPPGLRSWPRLATAASVLLCAPLFAGCGTAPPRVIVERPAIPETLLTCPDEPPAPDPETVTDTPAALYLIDLAEAGAACRDKLRAVREQWGER